MAEQMSKLEQVEDKIDNIIGSTINPEITTIKLLRLIATEQAKIIDLLNKGE